MKRATREQWVERVERWRTSGTTAAECARKLRVSEGALRWWKWRLDSERRESDLAAGHAQGAPPASVSPLTFVEMTTAVLPEPLELVLPGTIRIRIPSDFDSLALARVLDVLERRR
jgi:hypothetical protein